MQELDQLISERAALSADQLSHLRKLAADWQLIADLSFADLVLWIPLNQSEGDASHYLALAQVRAATAATIFPRDLVGEIKAFSNDDLADPELFPVIFKGEEIAIIARHRDGNSSRTLGRLESNYREIAQQLLEMVSEGTFPYEISISGLNPPPRVGDGFIRLDKNDVIIYASPNGRSAFSRLGWEGELEGLALVDATAGLGGGSLEVIQEQVKVNDISQFEFEHKGTVVEITVLPLIRSGLRVGSVVLLQNVTELRRRERELLLKDATIKEIHHRVKNNLQTVSALLRLQARRVDDASAKASLVEAERRIASIALVHETLSSSGKDQVDFDEVVDSLIIHAAEIALRAPGSTQQIGVKRLGSLGAVDPKIATPLALIITELVANAIEHGITSKGSKVDVIFSRTGSSCVVKIEDDGVGLPEDFDLKKSSNLGLQIVRTLTENELKGTLEINSGESGTSAQLRFELR